MNEFLSAIGIVALVVIGCYALVTLTMTISTFFKDIHTIAVNYKKDDKP